MGPIEGSWAVRYQDGTVLHQHDSQHPAYNHDNHEVPIKAIEWDRVASVLMQSQLDTREIPLPPAGPGYQWSMRWRVTVAAMGGTASAGPLRILMLVHSVAGVPVDEHSVDKVIYWSPMGILHECSDFECPDIRQYASRISAGKLPTGVIPIHGHVETKAEGLLQ